MEADLAAIKTAVFSQRPGLKEIYYTYGSVALSKYVKDHWVMALGQPNGEFLQCLQDLAVKIYGPDLAEKITRQLTQKPLISTLDHLGLWGHPIFVNSALIYSLYFQPAELAVVLATESVSLNNTSSWSGSTLVHSPHGKLERVSFFPDRLKTLPVFSAPAIGTKEIHKFSVKFGKNAQSVLNAYNILENQENFSIQACKATRHLWQKVFPSASQLVYLPLESLVLGFLEKTLKDEQSLFFYLTQTSKGRHLWQKHMGTERTFMFWGIAQKGRRESLTGLPEPKELSDLITNRKVYPSSPLCFVVLLYCSFACVGGFTQTTWLTEVKEKFIGLLSELGKVMEIEKISAIPTKNFAESNLAYLNIDKQIVQPTALDLYFKGTDDYVSFQNLSQHLTLGQSLDLAMPTIYEVVVPLKVRQNSIDLEVLRQYLYKQNDVDKLIGSVNI